MKKNFRKILCSLIAVVMMLLCVSVSAAEPTMNITWRGDYSDNAKPKLVVEFSSPVSYLQQVTAVVYKANVTNPSFADYIRAQEITVNGNAKTEITFNIGTSFNATDKAYKVALQGSGYQSDISFEAQTVYALTASDINGTTGLLARLNSASSASIMSVMDELLLPLQLAEEADATRKTKRAGILVDIRTSDYDGSFKTLEDVRAAWLVSDIIAFITDTDSTATDIKNIIDGNADILGIDISDADYIAHSVELCQDLIDYGYLYNNGNGIKSLKDLQGAVKEYLGVIAINNATDTTITNVFNKYKSNFSIPTETMTKYDALSAVSKGMVIGQLYSKNFAKPSDLVSAFTTATDGMAGGIPGTVIPGVVVPGATGGSPSNSMSGGAPSAPVTPVTPAPTGFSDVPASHWANPYVTELAKKDIISGYDDNTFKPNNSVTREEFVKMIVGAAGLYKADAQCEFTDVAQNAWFYPYIASAYAYELVSGVTDAEFGVGTKITRQDVAVIASRIIKKFKNDTVIPTETTLTDIDTVSDYAQDSVKLLNGMGIINGYDDGSFMPKNTLTRAEAATIIYKLINSL